MKDYRKINIGLSRLEKLSKENIDIFPVFMFCHNFKATKNMAHLNMCLGMIKKIQVAEEHSLKLKRYARYSILGEK